MNEAQIDELVARVQQGDSGAFGALVVEIRPELRMFLSAHAASIDMVEEILQAALVVCYRNIAKYERRGTFLPWVKGIARNLLLKELHALSRQVATERDVLDRIVVEAALEAAERDDPRDEESIERLERCIGKLPEGWQTMVRMRYFDRMSVRSVARQLGRSETSTAVTLFRIRHALRDCMEREADHG